VQRSIGISPRRSRRSSSNSSSSARVTHAKTEAVRAASRRRRLVGVGVGPPPPSIDHIDKEEEEEEERTMADDGAAAAAAAAGGQPPQAPDPGPDVAPVPALGDAPFSLLRVRGGAAAGASAGAFGASLASLAAAPAPGSGDALRYAIVSNMMLDALFLFSCMPGLRAARELVVLQSDGRAAATRAEAKELGVASAMGGAKTPHPPVPDKYGSHHSKFLLLFYNAGMRVVITSANFISPDVNRKTQSAFFQDFPRRFPQTDEEKRLAAGSDVPGARAMALPGANPLPEPRGEFERYLRDYLFVALSAYPPLRQDAALLLHEHDFASARAHLAASVPGTHHGARLERWGHARVRALLRADPRPTPARFSLPVNGGRTAVQCSSLGTPHPNWLAEMGVSFGGGQRQEDREEDEEEDGEEDGAGGAGGGKRKASSGAGGNGTNNNSNNNNKRQKGAAGRVPTSPPGPRLDDLFWTTVDEVRLCVEGWVAGVSIPASEKNANSPLLRPLMRRWGDRSPARRALYPPHVKTFVRYLPPAGACGAAPPPACPAEVAHAYVGSSNLSKAAWGQLQKRQGGPELQLRVLSFEMGVLLTPSREAAWRAHVDRAFTATPWDPEAAALAAAQQEAQARERAECGPGGGAGGGAPCPLERLAAREVIFYAWHEGCRPRLLLDDPRRGAGAGGGAAGAGAGAAGAAAAAGTGPSASSSPLPPLFVPLPIPFSLRNPQTYGQGDIPWDAETMWHGTDSRGRACVPRSNNHFYGNQDLDEAVHPW
jgi:hypothetical protein